MLTVKKIQWSGIVLLLIILGMSLSSVLEKQRKKKSEGVFYPGYSMETAYKITISRGDSTIVLTYAQDSLWYVSLTDTSDIYLADSIKVLSIVEKIAEMNRNTFVGTNRANDENYGLADNSAYTVTLQDANGNTQGSFILGKQGENWRHNYFRDMDSDNTYLVGGGIGYVFKVTVDDWRNRTVMRFNPRDVEKIELRFTDDRYDLSRIDDTSWNIHESSGKILPARTAEISEFLKTLSDLNVGGWAYETLSTEQCGFDQPTHEYLIHFKDGEVRSLKIGALESERPRYYAMVDENPEVLYLYKSTVELMVPNRENLIAEVPVEEILVETVVEIKKENKP